ncbi:DUF4167 domain-containing protein [Hyphomicrobium sp.]|uniref:DUF4167 domain-containing protein n=1 Tax=Hyphomicrobium sp. TaxID=82 RepID=UPI002FDC8564
MRQGQQNRRGRGRSNNNNNQNRKGQNPLTRSFESTGPDVKLRGTPAHIAEKYIALARDAQSSGDPVLAENYLQHAEHYNRIIMAYREQQMAQGGEMPNGVGRPRPAGLGEAPMGEDFGEEEGDLGSDAQPQAAFPLQAREGGQSRHYEGSSRYEGGGRPFHSRERQGGDRGERSYSDRPERGDRERGERYPRAERPERIERADRPDRAPQPDIAVETPPRRERQAAVPHHEQPEFLRRPVRRPRREAAAVSEGESAAAAPAPTPAVESSGD